MNALKMDEGDIPSPLSLTNPFLGQEKTKKTYFFFPKMVNVFQDKTLTQLYIYRILTQKVFIFFGQFLPENLHEIYKKLLLEKVHINFDESIENISDFKNKFCFYFRKFSLDALKLEVALQIVLATIMEVDFIISKPFSQF